jgi:hypothetical protein
MTQQFYSASEKQDSCLPTLRQKKGEGWGTLGRGLVKRQKPWGAPPAVAIGQPDAIRIEVKKQTKHFISARVVADGV